MSLEDHRSDHWKWFIIEAGLRTYDEQGHDAALAFLLHHKIDKATAERVLKNPEQRRTAVTWPTAKAEDTKIRLKNTSL